MKQTASKSLVTAGLALLALLAAGLVIRKEMYDYSPDRLYDRATAAHGVVVRKPSHLSPVSKAAKSTGKQPPANKIPAGPASPEPTSPHETEKR